MNKEGKVARVLVSTCRYVPHGRDHTAPNGVTECFGRCIVWQFVRILSCSAKWPLTLTFALEIPSYNKCPFRVKSMEFSDFK